MSVHVTTSNTGDNGNRVLWYESLAEYEAAKQTLELHNSTNYDPLCDKLGRISPRPELHFEIEALSGQVARYQVEPGHLDARDDHWSPVFRRKAAEVRGTWLTYRSNCEQLGADAAGNESDRLCDVQCAVESRLIEMPAPDQCALL